MPREPTGKPRGRPLGSGQLGQEGTDHIRLTVRLPRELYDALEAVAEQEHYTRETPELARTVRTALEHYLACPHRRQTRTVPPASPHNNGQTEIIPEDLEDNIRQTTIVQEPPGDSIRQTEIVPEPERTTTKPRATKRQTRNVPEHIQRIAETRAQYDTLSLAEFSKLLFDRNIYRAKDRQTGREKPVNRGTLQKWLEEIREVGLL